MPQHPVFRGKDKLVCFDRIQAEACFPQIKQLNYMSSGLNNENRQTTFNCRQTVFVSFESHKGLLAALFQRNQSVERLKFIADKTVPILTLL